MPDKIVKENKSLGKKKSKVVRVGRPERIILSAEESLRRMREFPKRRDKFIATMRGEGKEGQMTLTIDISKEAEARLKRQAKSNGKAFGVFVREMVEREAKEPTWDELVAPFHAETGRLGITDTELDELIDTELAAVRRERRLLSK